jgi:endonuclease-3
VLAGKNRIMKINWDAIFKTLEKWREDLCTKNRGEIDPSVTTVAEKYRHDPWAVLLSTILSLRTKDEVTLAASKRLLEKASTPEQLHAMKEENIAKLIYPAGFYRNKAGSLKKIAVILLEQYNGKVPESIDDLLNLPGVGRKRANLVLVEAFDKDALCVDIHVHRISNRLGWLESKNPDKTEMILREIMPIKYWKRLNYLLVLYGQKLCRPVSPFCSNCVIKSFCARKGIDRSR